MTRFEDPKTFFHTIYQKAAPWDIGRMQPSLTGGGGLRGEGLRLP